MPAPRNSRTRCPNQPWLKREAARNNERGPTSGKLALFFFTPASRRLGRASGSELTATASFLNGLFVIPSAAHDPGDAWRNKRLGGLHIVATTAESRATSCRELQNLGGLPLKTFCHVFLHFLAHGTTLSAWSIDKVPLYRSRKALCITNSQNDYHFSIFVSAQTRAITSRSVMRGLSTVVLASAMPHVAPAKWRISSSNVM